LILGTTTQRSTLQQLDLAACFDREMAVPNVNSLEELDAVCNEVVAFDSPRETQQSLEMLRDSCQTDSSRSFSVGVGIKRVLLGIETARQTTGMDRVNRFAEVIASMRASGTAADRGENNNENGGGRDRLLAPERRAIDDGGFS
jgi:vesicle-fusing ATPase